MRIGTLFSKIALCGLSMVMAAGSAHAAGTVCATVRGRLVHANGKFAAGVTVTVSNRQAGRSAPAHTGTDGIYYIPDIAPGQYFLEIWTNPGRTPVVYRVQVVPPATDVPQIKVP